MEIAPYVWRGWACGLGSVWFVGDGGDKGSPVIAIRDVEVLVELVNCYCLGRVPVWFCLWTLGLLPRGKRGHCTVWALTSKRPEGSDSFSFFPSSPLILPPHTAPCLAPPSFPIPFFTCLCLSVHNELSHPKGQSLQRKGAKADCLWKA